MFPVAHWRVKVKSGRLPSLQVRVEHAERSGDCTSPDPSDSRSRHVPMAVVAGSLLLRVDLRSVGWAVSDRAISPARHG
jgi:hypothetical protein